MSEQDDQQYQALSFEPIATPEPFRFKIGEEKGPNVSRAWEEKFELPALDDPGLPVELLPLAVLVNTGKSKDEMGSEAFTVFLDWIRSQRPDIARALNRHTQTTPVFMALLEAWAAHSGATPKASSSSGS